MGFFPDRTHPVFHLSIFFHSTIIASGIARFADTWQGTGHKMMSETDSAPSKLTIF